MRIRKFFVERFRSLRQVNLEEIGNFTIFIGANSSGKSNLLEAFTLFLSELDPAPLERGVGQLDDHLWFNRNDRQPIVFYAELEFERSELQNLALDEAAFKVSDENIVSIFRTIEGPHNSSKWTTRSVKLNNVALVEDNAYVEPTDGTQNTLRLLFESLKGKFTYLSAARDVAAQPPSGSRASFIDPSTLGELIQLGQSRDAAQSGQWMQFETDVTHCAPSIEDARIVANEMVIREQDTRIPVPVSLLGGGNQELMYLIYRIRQAEGQFLAIEEPEAHLHPKLARRLMDYLRVVAQDKQVFISTHSTIFVDQADLDNVWIVRRRKQGTEVLKLQSPGQLRSVLYELGSRPSDIFLADAMVFVEGPTEEKVIPIWASKMGIDFSRHGVRVRPTYGKDSGKYHLEVLTQATGNIGIPFFMILDKDAEKQARKLISKRQLTRNENLFLLQKGATEEYYPWDKFIDALKEALKSEYNLEITDEEVAEIEKGPRCDKIEALLQRRLKRKKAPRSWKPMVGEKVAQSMDLEELDSEIRGIIERILTTLRLR